VPAAQTLDQDVAAHYGRADLFSALAAALVAAGKDRAALTPADLAPVDEFHIGGRPATVHLADRLGFAPGAHLLDIGCGIGGASRYFAAERGCHVTGIDLTEAYCEAARRLAASTGLAGRTAYRQASALDLPFDDGAFDVVLSTYGAMFTPDHTRPAREMLRVTRSGGRIGLANWTPEGFIGQMFKVIGAYVPPPAGLKSPALWGTEPHLVALFGAEAADIRCVRKYFNMRYESPAHWIQVFRDFYGPVHRAFAALDAAKQADLEREIGGLLERCNVAGPSSLVVPSEYMEVVIVRR
jgi:SAM-dependent methyltransferase